ncbi:MAG: type 1 periplasmic binding fold superfamily protein [Flavobacteriales bacterium]|nr:type 1 periplasmic binding fold superfamily protein [Flavobacteriales bacterium]
MIGAEMTMLRTTVLLTFTLVLLSCKKDKEDPLTPAPPANEEEVITTLVVTFTDLQTFESKEFRSTDLDGDGGNDPVISTEELPSDREYTVTIQLLDETVSPPVNITQQVQDEAEEHQFFFQVNGAQLTIQYADEDADTHPLGLLNTATTLGAGTGTLRVTLRHGPDKGAAGVSGGDITNAGGDTDIEVTFPVTVV